MFSFSNTRTHVQYIHRQRERERDEHSLSIQQFSGTYGLLWQHTHNLKKFCQSKIQHFLFSSYCSLSVYSYSIPQLYPCKSPRRGDGSNSTITFGSKVKFLQSARDFEQWSKKDEWKLNFPQELCATSTVLLVQNQISFNPHSLPHWMAGQGNTAF